MKTFTISVTQTEINLGKVRTCSMCPVALATRRTLSAHGFDVKDGSSWPLCWVGLEWDGKRDRMRAVLIVGASLIELSPEVSKWVEMFDSAITVSPIEFELELPEAV